MKNACDGCQLVKEIVHFVPSRNGLLFYCTPCFEAKYQRATQQNVKHEQQAAETTELVETQPQVRAIRMTKTRPIIICKPCSIQTKQVSVVKTVPKANLPTPPSSKISGKSKWCDKCQALKPVNEFALKGNQRAWPCLACAGTYQSPLVKAKRPVQGEKERIKWCYECQQFKPANEFIPNGGIYISRCLGCSNFAEVQKIWEKPNSKQTAADSIIAPVIAPFTKATGKAKRCDKCWKPKALYEYILKKPRRITLCMVCAKATATLFQAYEKDIETTH